VNFERNGGMPEGTVLMAKRPKVRMPKKQTQKLEQGRSTIKTATTLLLSDESTSALDPKNKLFMTEKAPDQRSMLTTLAISHPPALEHAANAIYRPVRGNLVATETTRDRSS